MAMLMAVATTSCGIEVQYEQVPFEEIRGTCTLNPSKVTPNVIYSKAEFDKIYTNVSPQVDMASNIVIMVCAPKSAQGKKTGRRTRKHAAHPHGECQTGWGSHYDRFNAALVSGPHRPSGLRLFFIWKSISAEMLNFPMIPSTISR